MKFDPELVEVYTTDRGCGVQYGDKSINFGNRPQDGAFAANVINAIKAEYNVDEKHDGNTIFFTLKKAA